MLCGQIIREGVSLLNSKRCLLLVVDALSERILRRQLAADKLPNINRVLQSGGNINRCLSIFPSITPAATCSIVTGCYPSQHHIEGACWFDRDRSELAYFGDDLRFTMDRGMQDFFVDFADHLNYELLDCPTVFETLDQNGIDSVCINFMWFAGPHPHPRHTPFLLKALAGKLSDEVRGPRFLKIGEFVESLPEGVEDIAHHSIVSRYGFKDESTAEVLLKLAKADVLPPLTLGYFPNNDFQSHEEGPSKAAQLALQPFDDFLGQMIEAVGGWSRIGADVELVIVGDHSQTEFSDGGPDAIHIDRCLSQFKQSDPGSGWQDGDEIFICPNMRATAIYARRPDDEDLRRRIVERLLAEQQVDQVIYELTDGTRVVETGTRGRLAFRRAQGEDRVDVYDDYQNRWQIEGQLEAIDARIDSDGRFIEGDYPNPLERIDGAFVAGSFPIWATARTDSEFRLDETATHGGGSHGALNVNDSESALVTSAGVTLDCLTNPSRPRIIDVAPLCHYILGVLWKASERKLHTSSRESAETSSGVE